MTPVKTGRGRPKGTGLNDAAQLRAIAGLLASQPELKPTTAIRQLGIHDPSVIRRLRDKYHASETELIAEWRAGAVAAREAITANAVTAASHALSDTAPGIEPRHQAEAHARQRALALAPTRENRKSAPVEVAAAPVAPAVAAVEPVHADAAIVTAADVAAPVVAAPVVASPVALPPPPKRREPAFTRPSDTELPNWMGVGLSLFVFSVEAQYAAVGNLMQWSPFASALKSQAKFIEQAVAAAAPPRLGTSY